MALHKFQNDVLQDTSRLVLAGWARQTGKTETVQEIVKRQRRLAMVVMPTVHMIEAAVSALNPHKVSKSTHKMTVQYTHGGPMTEFVTPKYFDMPGTSFFATRYEAIVFEEPAHIPSELILNSVLWQNAQQIFYIGTPKKTEPNKLDGFTILYRLHEALKISVHEASFGDVLKERELAKLKDSFAFSDVTWKTEVLGQFS